jgi:transposase
MKVLHIIGADISKESIDFAINKGQHVKLENNRTGFRQLLRWLKINKINVSKSMIVMEHTGLYSYQFEQFLEHKKLQFTKVAALAIKRSMGMVRGKNDKIDAIRIARYGAEKKDTLIPAPATNESLQQLQHLSSARDKFVRNRASYIGTVNEYRKLLGLTDKSLLISSYLQIIKTLDKQIEKLEQEMELILRGEKNINNNYQLLQSIKSVGKVVAAATIIRTANFTRFENGRKFSCFCGTAPFEHTSGSSIRGRTRVSHMADKKMKSLLEMAARSAIQHDKELREYYLKQIALGKPKMSVMNVVRNKLIYRMFAVIKRQTPFIDNYLNVA